MQLTTGTHIHGFTLRRIRDVPGTNAQLVEMVYEKTGTELVWYKSPEPNKLFNVIFKTLPRDSTGVFHIIEHSLLCGSGKYPAKEPFVELMKSSMNTFLNAITFRDKTMYPVASRNEQDYLNLTAVYLDAVFDPQAMVNENIFLQEGWHHEIDGNELSHNGVVFNEMKGAMSSLDQVVDDGLHKLLFPDTSYGFNYGGDPAHIPELTYEMFRNAYRENYHPSNARIYLDGSVPLEKTLEMVDGYLSRFTPGKKQQEILQSPGTRELAVPSEAGPEEGQLVLAKLLGSWQDKPELLATRVLCELLCGSNDAPLKRAVLKAGLGQDVSMEVFNWVAQPFVSLRVHNMSREKASALRALIRETLEELVQTGLNQEELTAALNTVSFQAKDLQDPQALYRCLDVLGSWLYGGDPMLYLHFDETMSALREMARTGGFERLLRKLFLEEENLCVLHVVPSPDHGQNLRTAEKAKLAGDRQAMDDAALAALAARNERLHTWQQTPDDPAIVNLLPVLTLDQISPESQLLDTRREDLGNIPLLRHDTDTNGIVHLAAWFALTDLSREELTAAGFLADLLGKLPAGDSDAAELNQAVKTWLGSLEFSTEVLSVKGQPDLCTPFLVARCSVLRENLSQAKDLLAVILTRTQLHHPARIREVLLQKLTYVRQMAVMSGHTLGECCAQSHFSARNAAREAMAGYSRIAWLRDFAEDFENRADGFIAQAEGLLSRLSAHRMTLSVTADTDVDLADFAAVFPTGTPAPLGATYESPLPRKMAITIPAQVSYACAGYHLNHCSEPYRGTALLVSNILSLSCLWNSIRVQGGAYGAGMDCDRSGSIYCYSYRDPSPARSLDIYRGMADFVRDFPSSGESLVKYIISTIASTEPLRKPAAQGAEADRLWLAGITREDILRERRQLLEASMEDVLCWSAMLEQLARDAAICVVGQSTALDCCEEDTPERFTI